jgi:hypothetical protein
MKTVRAICKGFVLSLRYPSNLWRWPVAIAIRLPLFFLFTGLRLLADVLEASGDYIPAVKTSED